MYHGPRSFMNEDLRKRLSAEIHRIDWQPLAPHAKRGGLFIVDSRVDLLEVALAVATDDTAAVEGWRESGRLQRPTAEQIGDWQSETVERFTAVIVQPYVLVQRDTGPAVT